MTPAAFNRWQTFLRWGLGLLMLWAAISKIANPMDFLGSIYSYQVPLPKVFLKALACALPWCELLCSLLLLANLWTSGALLCLNLLLLVFIIATGQAWFRGLPISCGCFDLNWMVIGSKTAALQRILESVAFAFFRNLGLWGIVSWLLYHNAEDATVKLVTEVPSPIT